MAVCVACPSQMCQSHFSVFQPSFKSSRENSRIGYKFKGQASEQDGDHTHNCSSLSKETFRYIYEREYGLFKGNPQKLAEDYVAQQMPGIFKETEYELGDFNKVFASTWLNDRQVVFGTKCNKLMVTDVSNGNMVNIPSLKSSEESTPAYCPCGIHSIAINPSQTLLATGSENTNDLAVYKLPTFDPVCVGEGGHQDWIFDMKWIDDQFIVSGSRDNKLALWKIDNYDDCKTSRLRSLQIPEYVIKKPETVSVCEKAEKVRALGYNDERSELAVISLNAYFHLYDIEKFTQVQSRKLPYHRENVCMAVSKEKCLYGIGSQSHVNLIDPRSLNVMTSIVARQVGCGIRSVSFRKDIITIGTGTGQILFFDIKAGKYLECNCGHPCNLKVGTGWLLHDDNYRNYFMDQTYPNAIYSHCYDSTGLRLFAAGGPLPAGLSGNYAGLWS